MLSICGYVTNIYITKVHIYNPFGEKISLMYTLDNKKGKSGTVQKNAFNKKDVPVIFICWILFQISSQEMYVYIASNTSSRYNPAYCTLLSSHIHAKCGIIVLHLLVRTQC